jgi:hypothetical protein
MRFVQIYLAVYFVLVIGAGLALWQAGILARIPPMWIGLTAVVTIALGLLVAYTSPARPNPIPAAE